MAGATEVDIETRLATLRADKDKRLEQRDREAKAQEVVILELEAKLEEELGPRGQSFEIVDAREDGPIAVKLGAMILYKRFMSLYKKDKEPTHEDMYNYVAPCVVHPAREVFAALCDRKPILVVRCANALTALYGGKEDDARSKY